MPSEMLTGWPTPYPTPWPTPSPAAAYIVEAEKVELTEEVMRMWFKQSIKPLVGEEAADVLDELIKCEQPKRGGVFLQKAIAFRRTFVK